MKKSILFITSLFLCIFCLKSNAQQSRTEVTWEKMEDVTVPIPPQVHPRALRTFRRSARPKETDEPPARKGGSGHPEQIRERPHAGRRGKGQGQRLPLLLRNARRDQPRTRYKPSNTSYTATRNKQDAPLPPCWTRSRT